MLNTYITASINNTTIYVKVNSSIIMEVFDILIDNKYVVDKTTQDEWNINIENGISYEIDTLLELEEFTSNNKQFNYET
jgi:hypothetical protein